MTCQIEQFADCGDISTIARALFISDKEDRNWLTQCPISLSSCGNLLAVGHRSRLCLLTAQWISSSDSNTYVISWSGTLPSEVTALLALPISPSQQSSQNGPDWFCIIVGFKNGGLGFYTNTGHKLFLEKLDEKPVLKISCHTGTYGTLPEDICVLYPNMQCIITGQSLFQTLRYAKAQLARVEAGAQSEYCVDGRGVQARRWTFGEQEVSDAAVVGLELKNTYDHLLAASTYGGYDTWYRSIPPANTLVLCAGQGPYLGFQYALEGGAAPPLQDVARAVATRIKSALPGWLGGGGGTTEGPESGVSERARAEPLCLRGRLDDAGRIGAAGGAGGVALSPDRRLAAVPDNYGRVALLDLARGRVHRLLKGCRDAQCAFVQVFEQDNKKPHLSTIKETRRAVFLVVYKPRRGLVDVRLMAGGRRAACYTATRHGRLIYNTSGLVGGEPGAVRRRLNLPAHQAALLDPDGSLKRFNIPFHLALQGPHSDRARDLHILRDLREYMKTTSRNQLDKDEIVKKATEINTLELKKHCIEMLIRNYNVPPDIVMACVAVFWNGDESSENEAIMTYFRNVVLVTLFYRRLSNESVEDMCELVEIVNPGAMKDEALPTEEEPELGLLEDDDCVLERLLMLAQERDYRQQQTARVTFADTQSDGYKDFVTSFQLSETSPPLLIKPDLSTDKLNALASYTFKSLLQMDDLKKVTSYIKESNIETQEVIRLVVVHTMNMSLEDINLDLIRQLIEVLYHVCGASGGARRVVYNEASEWWRRVRELLATARCPLRGLLLAASCRAVAATYEQQARTAEDSEAAADTWEAVTTESAQWGFLIGKLEDISILSIVLVLKETFIGDALPKLTGFDFDINLDMIYSRGKGSVTELVAKWLCSMGVPPEAVVAHELIEKPGGEEEEEDKVEGREEDEASALFVSNWRRLVDDNPRIFKWVSLVRQQFPCSARADYLLVHMCWEYAARWTEGAVRTARLRAALRCVRRVLAACARAGLATLVWTTHVAHVFENACRLLNKVGKMPKEGLCQQSVGLTDAELLDFLDIATEYLELLHEWTTAPDADVKTDIKFEKIWEESAASLVETAQESRRLSATAVVAGQAVGSAMRLQAGLGLRVSKPLASLFDFDCQGLFEALSGRATGWEADTRPSEKIRHARMKFINKVVRAAAETVSVRAEAGRQAGPGGAPGELNAAECLQWTERAAGLAALWGLDPDYVKQQETICFFHLGYDSLAAQSLADTDAACAARLLGPLLAAGAQRLRRHLERSAAPHEWLAAAPPALVSHVTSLESDPSVAEAPLASTAAILSSVLRRLPEPQAPAPGAPGAPGPDLPRQVALAELMLSACETLEEIVL